MTDLMRAREAYEYLNLSTEGALRVMVSRRQVPFIKLGKKRLRFSRRQLDEWIAKQTVPANPA